MVTHTRNLFLILILSLLMGKVSGADQPTKKSKQDQKSKQNQESKESNQLEKVLRHLLLQLVEYNTQKKLDRRSAKFTIKSLGPKALPQLTQLLKDKNPQIREGSALALGLLGAKAKPAIPKLILALGDSNGDVQREAEKTLAKLGKYSLPNLIQALSHKNVEIRRGAINGICSFDNIPPSTIPSLIKILRDPVSSCRYYAARTLQFIGPPAKAAIPELKRLLNQKHEDLDNRIMCAEALGKIAPQNPKVIGLLIHHLSDPEESMRSSLAKVLGEIGPKAAPAVPFLVKLLSDKGWKVSQHSAEALGKIGSPTANQAVPHLIKILLSPNRFQNDLKCSAARALGRIGPVKPTVIPALVQSIKGNHWTVQQVAIEALGKIGEPAASTVPVLIKALQSLSWNVRNEAALTLGKIGPKAASSIPHIIQQLNDPMVNVRITAAETLGLLKTPTPQVVNALNKSMGDPNPYVAKKALEALQKLKK